MGLMDHVVAYYNFSNLKYSMHKIYIHFHVHFRLLAFVCVCVQFFFSVEPLIIDHMISMGTTSKIGTKHKLLSFPEKLGFINMVGAT
jgi:hypothetical protein